MAINIEWQALPAQNNDTDGKALLYPRMTENGEIDFKSLCEKVAKGNIYTKGTVEGVLSDAIEIIAELLQEGKTVNLESFGTFKLSIGSDANITPDIPYSKRNIIVRGVNFQPCKSFMDAIGSPVFRTVPRYARTVAMSQEQLQDILQEYFKTHDSITRLQFENLCKLKRATACLRLKKLVESGFLVKVGDNRDTKYIFGTTKNDRDFTD